MSCADTFHQWECDPAAIKSLTPVKVRDLIIACFYQAQKETYASVRRETPFPTTDEFLKNIVWGAVHRAFDQAGVDFCHPTKEGLRKVVELLAARASSWETPKEVVDYNASQIIKAIDALPNDK